MSEEAVGCWREQKRGSAQGFRRNARLAVKRGYGLENLKFVRTPRTKGMWELKGFKPLSVTECDVHLVLRDGVSEDNSPG